MKHFFVVSFHKPLKQVGFKQCLHDISALIGGASMKSEETTPEVKQVSRIKRNKKYTRTHNHRELCINPWPHLGPGGEMGCYVYFALSQLLQRQVRQCTTMTCCKMKLMFYVTWKYSKSAYQHSKCVKINQKIWKNTAIIIFKCHTNCTYMHIHTHMHAFCMHQTMMQCAGW